MSTIIHERDCVRACTCSAGIARWEAERPHIGDVIHGHVEGWFGRDHYACARIEAMGEDWVVVRTLTVPALPVTATGNAGLTVALRRARGCDDYPHSLDCPKEAP